VLCTLCICRVFLVVLISIILIIGVVTVSHFPWSVGFGRFQWKNRGLGLVWFSNKCRRREMDAPGIPGYDRILAVPSVKRKMIQLDILSLSAVP